MSGINSETFIAPGAVIEGEVELGRNSSVWFGTVLRGDLALIRVGEGSNLQDGCVVHVGHDQPTVIGHGVSVGHQAVVHACTVEDGALIGISAVVLDGARVGRESIVGAGAVVPSGMDIPPRSLAVGIPAKVVREVTEEEVEANRERARKYVELWQNRYRSGPAPGNFL